MWKTRDSFKAKKIVAVTEDQEKQAIKWQEDALAWALDMDLTKYYMHIGLNKCAYEFADPIHPFFSHHLRR